MQKNFNEKVWSGCLGLILGSTIVWTLSMYSCGAHAWENNYQYQLEIQRQQTDFQNQQYLLQQQQNNYMEQQRQQQQAQDALNQQFRQMGQRNY